MSNLSGKEVLGEPAHMHRLIRVVSARIYKGYQFWSYHYAKDVVNKVIDIYM